MVNGQRFGYSNSSGFTLPHVAPASIPCSGGRTGGQRVGDGHEFDTVNTLPCLGLKPREEAGTDHYALLMMDQPFSIRDYI
jgi:hypothetical protein